MKSNQMVREIPNIIIVMTLLYAGVGGGNFIHFLNGISERNIPKICGGLLGAFLGFYTSYVILCYAQPKQ